MQGRQGGGLSPALNASISVIITLIPGLILAMLAGRVRDVCFSGGRREEGGGTVGIRKSCEMCSDSPQFAEESCHVSLT